jgi:hypothetical protein
MCPGDTTRRQTNSPKSHRDGSLSPRTSLLETSPNHPSPSIRIPRIARNPRGPPRIQRAQSPWTRTRRMRRTCSPSSRGTAPARPKSWTSSQLPAGRTGVTNTSPGWTEGNSPRNGPRPSASPGWPNPSPSSTASCTSTPPQASCSEACPSPEGRELLRDIHAGICGHHAAPRTLAGNAFRQGFY